MIDLYSFVLTIKVEIEGLMENYVREKTRQIKMMTESLKRRSSIYSSLSKIDDKGTARSLGALQRASAPGKKLQKIGFIMFWFPEPTGVTNVIGGPMILAGKYLDKVYNGSTIADIGKQTKSSLSDINDFKKTVSE